MTRLYIANCTTHPHTFLYRIQGVSQMYSTVIAAGGQNEIYEDTDRKTLELIIDQHRPYGLRSLAELDRTKSYTGLCYQFDKFIDVERIMEGITKNDLAMELAGHALRKNLAAAMSATLDQNATLAGTKLQGVELEIQEEQTSVTDHSDKMTEVIAVAKPGSKYAAKGAQRERELNDRK